MPTNPSSFHVIYLYRDILQTLLQGLGPTQDSPRALWIPAGALFSECNIDGTGASLRHTVTNPTTVTQHESPVGQLPCSGQGVLSAQGHSGPHLRGLRTNGHSGYLVTLLCEAPKRGVGGSGELT